MREIDDTFRNGEAQTASETEKRLLPEPVLASSKGSRS